jgi:hypothetical protein
MCRRPAALSETASRLLRALGRQRHDLSHIGVAPGGSGTANAFSRYEISV